MFLDGLEGDVERMKRINLTLQMIPPERSLDHSNQLRNIPVLLLQPSMDLGALVLKEGTDDTIPYPKHSVQIGIRFEVCCVSSTLRPREFSSTNRNNKYKKTRKNALVAIFVRQSEPFCSAWQALC